jgi:hypothetical protein
MGSHRRAVRPRYGRIAVAGVSCLVTGIALLGGVGMLPFPVAADPAGGAAIERASYPQASASSEAVTPSTAGDVRASQPDPSSSGQADPGSTVTAQGEDPAALPADSGQGRRVVFSEGEQRVWIVSGGQRVKRTYLVSGSVYDNLDPGTYEVFSRSENAWGVDGSTMRLFVRFTHGDSAAIGFHTIPELGGSAVQTASQLGTPLSHGCIRQKERDAVAMWHFAQLGTTVVVTA